MEEVISHCDESDDDYDDDLDLDDPDEPIMDGSDDEFSDLEGDDLDDPGLGPSLTAGCLGQSDTPDPSDSPDPSNSPGSTTWTATTKRIPIQPFTSPTGPIEDISSSPMEVFNMFFPPEIMEEIVKQRIC